MPRTPRTDARRILIRSRQSPTVASFVSDATDDPTWKQVQHTPTWGNVWHANKHEKTCGKAAEIGLLQFEPHGSCVLSENDFSFTTTEMTQQNWPFENRICGVTSGQEMNDTNDDDEADDDQDVADENIVYIVEGGQICYGSKRAWDTCRNS